MDVEDAGPRGRRRTPPSSRFPVKSDPLHRQIVLPRPTYRNGPTTTPTSRGGKRAPRPRRRRSRNSASNLGVPSGRPHRIRARSAGSAPICDPSTSVERGLEPRARHILGKARTAGGPAALGIGPRWGTQWLPAPWPRPATGRCRRGSLVNARPETVWGEGGDAQLSRPGFPLQRGQGLGSPASFVAVLDRPEADAARQPVPAGGPRRGDSAPVALTTHPAFVLTEPFVAHHPYPVVCFLLVQEQSPSLSQCDGFAGQTNTRAIGHAQFDEQPKKGKKPPEMRLPPDGRRVVPGRSLRLAGLSNGSRPPRQTESAASTQCDGPAGTNRGRFWTEIIAQFFAAGEPTASTIKPDSVVRRRTSLWNRALIARSFQSNEVPDIYFQWGQAFPLSRERRKGPLVLAGRQSGAEIGPAAWSDVFFIESAFKENAGRGDDR